MSLLYWLWLKQCSFMPNPYLSIKLQAREVRLVTPACFTPLHRLLWDITFLSSFSCLSLVLESLPPARYRETISTLLSWLQQCEAKLAIPSTAVTEYLIMEQRLKDNQVCSHTHIRTVLTMAFNYCWSEKQANVLFDWHYKLTIIHSYITWMLSIWPLIGLRCQLYVDG